MFIILFHTNIDVRMLNIMRIVHLQELCMTGVTSIYADTKRPHKTVRCNSSESKKELLLVLESLQIKDGTLPVITGWENSCTPLHYNTLLTLLNGYMKKVLGPTYTSRSFALTALTED
jgi:hypothetical protein